ncbi:PEP/pyruvate-binding domain-containing protein [Sphaerisporangium sp. NPDC049002]|uniref:PEP/pyruvate-binding domain-containing protein n=1 Tax=unclassified Sphaerisporangium TaxID=2630420 RepID=UPI0033D38A20
MILTGTEIAREWANGRITIDPFTPEQVNPNSYNFRLGRTLCVYRDMPLDARHGNECDEIEIPDEGYVLEPGRLYLAHTIEVLGSEYYAPTFAARSSVARLGLFINLSASLGDIGYKGQWTLQLYSMNAVRVYPGINIGQMMWWRPQGDIELYDGKYQGATGPRSSDIHKDFHKQFARQRFIGLGASVDPARTGPKFAALAANSRRFRVPNAFCISAEEFDGALSDDQRRGLAAAFNDLRATVGAFLTDSLMDIQKIVSGVHLTEQARQLLAVRIADMFGDDESVEFAVRSSGLDEDTAGSSLAGIHTTVLGVQGVDAVAQAVEQCWRSYYGASAVAARVRAGDFSHTPRLAVIVQRMIRPELAGVAFSDPEDGVVIEYVEGLADSLVAGVAVPVLAKSAELTGDVPALAEVVRLVQALRAAEGYDVDVEWAADADGVHLIQVRPQTAASQQNTSHDEPVADAYRLYFDEIPASVDLGEVSAVYGGYAAKRGPAHRLAVECGVGVGHGWVVHFNGRGLCAAETGGRLREVIDEGCADECVLDFGDTLRQIVVHKAELLSRLAETTGAGPDSTRLHTVIVRDYLRGDLGIISRRVGDDFIVEYTPEGLMALNRGTSGAAAVMIRNGQVDPADSPINAHVGELAEFTRAMSDRYGPMTLEWVRQSGKLFFVDYSLLGGDALNSADARVISAGTAAGPLLALDEDEVLSRLSIGPAVSVDRSQDLSGHEGLREIIARVRACSEPPIVRASRPYAVLSVLIGDVAGFVFDQGSTLGHLAILLREAGLPAVAAQGLPSEGHAVISSGTVTVTGGK